MHDLFCNVGVIQTQNRKLKVEFTNNTNKKTLQNGRVCFFPMGPWKDIPSISKKKEYNDYIYVFDLEQNFFNYIREKVLANFKSIDEHFTTDLFKEIRQKFEYIESSKLRSAEIRIFPSRKRSTAYNFSLGHYLGLHIDSHDSIANEQRSISWHLLCLNLGLAERYLYFVDITFDYLIKVLNIENTNEVTSNNLSMHKVVALFFEKFPDYPIKRIKMLPGTGYMIRPQNLIHDGGTNWKGTDDISYLAGITFYNHLL